MKEICEPRGAIIHADAFQLADPTINVLELWGAEYQVRFYKPAKSTLFWFCNYYMIILIKLILVNIV